MGALQLLERQERAIHQLELVIQNISVEFRVVGKASSAVLQYHVDIDGVLLGESALAAQILVAERMDGYCLGIHGYNGLELFVETDFGVAIANDSSDSNRHSLGLGTKSNRLDSDIRLYIDEVDSFPLLCLQFFD